MTHSARILSKIALGLTLSIGTIAATGAGFAQTTQIMAKVPFAFSADNHALPAGTYAVVISAQQRTITLANLATGEFASVVAHENSWEDNKGGTRLTFRREAGKVYLTKVWVAGRTIHSDVSVHIKPNREMASSAKAESTFEVAAE
jgi:hypothetical protein